MHCLSGKHTRTGGYLRGFRVFDLTRNIACTYVPAQRKRPGRIKESGEKLQRQQGGPPPPRKRAPPRENGSARSGRRVKRESPGAPSFFRESCRQRDVASSFCSLQMYPMAFPRRVSGGRRPRPLLLLPRRASLIARDPRN